MSKLTLAIFLLISCSCFACVTVQQDTYTVDQYGAKKTDKTKFYTMTPTDKELWGDVNNNAFFKINNFKNKLNQ